MQWYTWNILRISKLHACRGTPSQWTVTINKSKQQWKIDPHSLTFMENGNCSTISGRSRRHLNNWNVVGWGCEVFKQENRIFPLNIRRSRRSIRVCSHSARIKKTAVVITATITDSAWYCPSLDYILLAEWSKGRCAGQATASYGCYVVSTLGSCNSVFAAAEWKRTKLPCQHSYILVRILTLCRMRLPFAAL